MRSSKLLAWDLPAMVLKMISRTSVVLGSTSQSSHHISPQLLQQRLLHYCSSTEPEETDLISTVFPATVTVGRTTETVFSPTATVTVTTTQVGYEIKRRSHVRRNEHQARAAAPAITPRAELPEIMLLNARQAASSATKTLDGIALGYSLSSACSCLFLSPLTTYLAFTAPSAVSCDRARQRLLADESRRGSLELQSI
jgi:hypothetical protein